MVSVDDEAFAELTKASVYFKMSKRAYASAAVLYFARLGVNPADQNGGAGVPDIAAKLGELSQKIDTLQDGARKQSADIANRLVGIWRTLERNLYTHLGGEQNALYLYMQSIEENLLGKLSATESQYLWPLMERLMRGSNDSLIARRLTSDLIQMLTVLVPPGKVAESEMTRVNNELSASREAIVVKQSREMLEGLKLTERVASRRPSIAVPPSPAVPSKPTPPPATPPTPA
ncbi:hypothetical protein CDA63_18975 [Hymenobacter amundsenii]|uniref:Uncharacterized protein n=2 Tax=Hymenobacter amundsenii TaxID=2006685 RepID=A0A246FG56_9BACT|nr:hypothetical protein CDA63_18975 [Hymenobacter amundsenii]